MNYEIGISPSENSTGAWKLFLNKPDSHSNSVFTEVSQLYSIKVEKFSLNMLLIIVFKAKLSSKTQNIEIFLTHAAQTKTSF